MKTNLLLLIPLLAATAATHAADSTPSTQAKPPASASDTKSAMTSKAVAGPKIHEMMATRNADGSLTVGCIERPNPHAANALSPRVNAPEAQK